MCTCRILDVFKVKHIMSELITCPTCKGRKVYMGIGMIESKCAKCNAIGWISKPIEEKPDEVAEELEVEQPIKLMQKNIKRPYNRKCR